MHALIPISLHAPPSSAATPPDPRTLASAEMPCLSPAKRTAAASRNPLSNTQSNLEHHPLKHYSPHRARNHVLPRPHPQVSLSRKASPRTTNVTLSCPSPPSPPSSPECKNPYDRHDPPCKHNTSLFTSLSPHPANCAHCVASDASPDDNATTPACPPGWHGIDCGACTARSACPDKRLPDGRLLVAKGCTSNCLVPTPEETSKPPLEGWEGGKVRPARQRSARPPHHRHAFCTTLASRLKGHPVMPGAISAGMHVVQRISNSRFSS
jgi:hypothetical protein